MSYTPHTWQTGETITAEKMNNIEGGIQEAASSGGGGVDATIWQVDSSGGMTVDGDFASARSKLESHRPIVVLYYEQHQDFSFFLYPVILGVGYNSADPDKITLHIDSAATWIWTANGIEDA